LDDFENLREENKSRGEYISELKQAAGGFYSYNEQLVDFFFDLFSPREVFVFRVINVDHTIF
jgi:hypothetical protein